LPITLGAATQKIVKTGGGATSETNDSAAVLSVAHTLNQISLRFDFGTPATNSFAAGTQPGSNVNIDLVNNLYTLTGPSTSISASDQTTLHNGLVAWINVLETFLVKNNITGAGGTQVART
jgi:hypothetical protein